MNTKSTLYTEQDLVARLKLNDKDAFEYHADGGVIASMGFLCLAIVWFTSTFMGYTSILKGRVTQHQQLMVFSYAACFAAVTLRIWLPLLVAIYQDFIKAYLLVAWLCWLPNMSVAYLLTRNMNKSVDGNCKVFHA